MERSIECAFPCNRHGKIGIKKPRGLTDTSHAIAIFKRAIFGTKNSSVN